MQGAKIWNQTIQTMDMFKEEVNKSNREFRKLRVCVLNKIADRQTSETMVSMQIFKELLERCKDNVYV